MAEDHVSSAQHRADMAELRGELKEEMAGVRQELKDQMSGIRQEISALTKTVEANQQTMLLRFEQVDQQMAADRQSMMQRFEQVDRQFEVDRQYMMRQFQLVDQQFSRHDARASIMASATCGGTACRAFSPWPCETT